MPPENIIERSFSGGELAPALYGRVDQTKYQTGLKTARNLICMRHGGVTQRPGTMYVGTSLNGGNPVRLIPFIFNETGIGQSYVLEFGNQYVAFYQDGGNIVDVQLTTITSITKANPGVITVPIDLTGVIANGHVITIRNILGMTQLNNSYFRVANLTFGASSTFTLLDLTGAPVDTTFYDAFISGGEILGCLVVPTPYLQADLSTLNYSQSNDVLTIAHKNYPPKELRRNTPIFWALSNVTFDGTGVTPTNVVLSGGTVVAFPKQIYYQVTAIMANGDESIGAISAQSNLAASSAAPITITWNPVPLAVSYRIYKNDIAQAPSIPNLGFIGVTADGFNTTFVDSGFVPDYSQGPPISGALKGLVASGQYPSVVGTIQQRRAFANTPNNQIGCWLSASGSPTNYTINTNTSDNDSISFDIAGEEVNAIQHILEQKFMLMLTAGAELFVQGNGSGVVTPSAINASVQSQYGSSSLKPIKAGEVIIFNQALGSFIRDLSFDFVIDGYRGNDLTIFSSHLFEGHQIVDWAYQKVPDSILWAVREDGVLLSLTYIREQQILAWTRHDLDSGGGGNITTLPSLVQNIVAIPENGQYAVYVAVKRSNIVGSPIYIERLSSRIWTDPIDATYLDCWMKFDGRNTSNTTMQLFVIPSAPFVTDATAYQQQLTLSASAPFFTAAMVGDQIFMEDAQWVSSMGQQGNQIRLTIMSFIDSQNVIVTPDKAVPATLQTSAGAFTSWARAVNQVTGLNPLRGQFVSIWADRFAVASPLHSISDGSAGYSVTQSGTLEIPLPQHYSVIYIGLPITADFETLAIDTAFGEATLGERKLISRVVVYLLNSRGFFAGTENPDTNPDNPYVAGVNDPLFQLIENKAQENRQLYDPAPSLLTDWQFTNIECASTKEGRIFIRNVDPIPLSILAVVPSGLTTAKVAWSQKV